MIDVCSEFHRAKTSQWRTLLFFREYQHSVDDSERYDVTFVAQLSYDRLQMVEELVKYWQGWQRFVARHNLPRFHFRTD